jgi:D-3-phosphoglycerate dehydrogenase / 2-oxoglutarate reductase
MSKKILLLDNVNPVCADIFKERGMQADQPPAMELDQLKKIIGDYDGMVVRSATKVDADLLQHAGRLAVIGRAGVGVDNIDIQAATTHGVLVMNTPDGNTISTAEHTCGLILALSRNIPEAVSKVKAGGWDRKKFMGTEVHGKKLGVIGLGKIGSEVSRRMKAFGMDVYAYDPFATHEHAEELGSHRIRRHVLVTQEGHAVVVAREDVDAGNVLAGRRRRLYASAFRLVRMAEHPSRSHGMCRSSGGPAGVLAQSVHML